MKLSRREWGCMNGRAVYLFDLENGGIHASVSNYGGILQALRVKNGRGETIDAVLGYNTLQEYACSETFFGAMVGPIADRLGEGRCVLDGKTVQFPLNAGPDCMHSGAFGFHAILWDWEELEDGIAFKHSFSDGDLPLSGCLQVRLAYRITAENTLRMEYCAVCDRETALSFTNHSYFTLNGGRDDCWQHEITIYASRYAETCREDDPICTGRELDVSGTPFDLRCGAGIGDVLVRNDFREIRSGGGIDHYFCVDGEGMRCHAQLLSRQDGLLLRCFSDAQGVLVYTANGLDEERGKEGSVYGKNWAVCLETERFPNGVNLPGHRRGIVQAPGEAYQSATEWRFSVVESGDIEM